MGSEGADSGGLNKLAASSVFYIYELLEDLHILYIKKLKAKFKTLLGRTLFIHYSTDPDRLIVPGMVTSVLIMLYSAWLL